MLRTLRAKPLLKNAYFQLAIFRILFALVGIFYLGLGQYWGYFKIPETTFLYYSSSFIIYSTLILYSVKIWPYVTWRNYMTIFVDMTYVSFGIIFSGSPTDLIFIIYIWLILSQALRQRRSFIHTAQIIALIQYSLIIYYYNYIGYGVELYQSFFIVLTLILFPLNMDLFFNILMRSRHEAEEANQAKSQFLANMSHELRTPLNAVIGYSEILYENADARSDVNDKKDLSTVITSSKRLLNLINDILDLSKIDSNKMELQEETIYLKDFIDEIKNIVQPSIDKQNNTFIINNKMQIDSIYADQRKLHQSIVNLISNAAKFTKEGEITLTIYSEEFENITSIVFSIEDTGIGINEDDLSLLFDAFYQGYNRKTSTHGGTGLGLAISKQFCELMGGNISAYSKVGIGSRFLIRLPINNKKG